MLSMLRELWAQNLSSKNLLKELSLLSQIKKGAPVTYTYIRRGGDQDTLHLLKILYATEQVCNVALLQFTQFPSIPGINITQLHLFQVLVPKMVKIYSR